MTNPDTLARIDAALRDHDTHKSGAIPGLAIALQDARAEIVRRSALITEPPTDDEREAIAEIVLEHFHAPDERHPSWWIRPHETADAIIASPVWRNRGRGPITDEIVNAGAKALDENFNPDRYPVMAAMFRDYARTVLEAAEEARR